MRSATLQTGRSDAAEGAGEGLGRAALFAAGHRWRSQVIRPSSLVDASGPTCCPACNPQLALLSCTLFPPRQDHAARVGLLRPARPCSQRSPPAHNPRPPTTKSWSEWNCWSLPWSASECKRAGTACKLSAHVRPSATHRSEALVIMRAATTAQQSSATCCQENRLPSRRRIAVLRQTNHSHHPTLSFRALSAHRLPHLNLSPAALNLLHRLLPAAPCASVWAAASHKLPLPCRSSAHPCHPTPHSPL